MNHLVIMAKQPIAGRVKSRLAKDIGFISAAGVYRNLMTETMRTLARDNRWRTWASVAPDNAVYDHNWPTNLSVLAQGRGDLGVRMQRILDGMPVGPVIIIGTDIPFITSNNIADAFKMLGANHVVFGNAGDGGYWLAGARRTPRVPVIFNNVRWSGQHALADTMKNCVGKKIGFAADHFDIDNQEDFVRWRKMRAISKLPNTDNR